MSFATAAGGQRASDKNSAHDKTWSIVNERHSHKLVLKLQKRRFRETNGKGRYCEDRRTTAVYVLHTAFAERKESQPAEGSSPVLKTS